MTGQSKCSLQSGQYLGEISALCFLNLPPHLSSLPFLLAGAGSQALLYDLETGNMIRMFQVFKGIRVHGISCEVINWTKGSLSMTITFKIAVFGERRVKVFTLAIEKVVNSQNPLQVCEDLVLLSSLPKFSHWVLDVCFLKGYITYLRERSHYLAIGCSDNSVCFWDILRSYMTSEVRSPEKCLLYSMRMWGDDVEALRIASGTIYNEIIVWKVVSQIHGSCLTNHVKNHVNLTSSFDESIQFHGQQYEAVHICRLVGHEGSIFRIVWSSNGLKLVSVSDDRSARIWEVQAEKKGFDHPTEIVSMSAGAVLFGHTARVWDCYITDNLIITAGEDCTCRVWRLDGTQVKMIKEHIGRGVWRCLYDPYSSLLVTAGFDSAIKVHRLHASLPKGVEKRVEVLEEFVDQTKIFTLRIPNNSSEHIGLMDSKSEYVRCLHFSREDTLYVATNNGYLYHAKIPNTGDVQWSELIRVSEEVPIVCMNLLSRNPSDYSCGIEDWVALGDGKGNMTVVRVVGDVETPKVGLAFTWSAGTERQLLGTYWCKSLGYRFIFTADPRGTLKLWRLFDSSGFVSLNSMRSHDVSLIAEFISCFGIRIMCLDASFGEEVLVCGDLRGHLLLFPLSRGLLLGKSVASEVKMSPLTYFKGAHGISSVCSIAVTSSSSTQIEVHSTGGDGCICHLEYDRNQQNLEFIGMKQVKELSLVRSVFPNADSHDEFASGNYAIGFASADFIIWNLLSETKVVQVPCGGWRRPHAYYLGDVPEMINCFAFVKDEMIYIHRHRVPDGERKVYPQHLHLQFHGREMHSLCFISEDSKFGLKENQGPVSKSAWIATGCEDGTVRLTRYDPGVENWSVSKLLGEHVGGSAVRSICSVSKIHVIAADLIEMPYGMYRQEVTLEDVENPFLLISVGAKRVLTVWKRKISMRNKKEEALLLNGLDNGTGNVCCPSSGVFSSMSFQWLSTDMQTKNGSTHGKGKNMEKVVEINESVFNTYSDATSSSLSLENRKMDPKTCIGSKYEDDWRYLAVTAFFVKVANSRISVCFTVVACSDTTVALRALILPNRLWFDIALLAPLSSPVLALQHAIFPISLQSEDSIQMGSLYVVISGSTDGSIAFWDLTEKIETFMRRVSAFQMENYIDCQKRPLTGRGSQGGRWWRSLASRLSKEKTGDGSGSTKTRKKTSDNMQNHAAYGTLSKLSHSERRATACSQAMNPAYLGSEASVDDPWMEICEVQPLHILKNAHQSGVNCLHISDIKASDGFDSDFLYSVVSGGDDQALCCFRFYLELLPLGRHSENISPGRHSTTESESSKNCIHYCRDQKYRIRFLYHDKIVSAHSSAIKGVWTDGTWVFSTGLDQRVRCWHLQEHGKLTECAQLIVSVPEPEALDARAFGRNHYQIAVAGRGMQMVEFFAPGGIYNGE